MKGFSQRGAGRPHGTHGSGTCIGSVMSGLEDDSLSQHPSPVAEGLCSC
jgi:hypothetical protein